jgi:hypothetical protein
MGNVDWEEAGVPELWLAAWWDDHKAQDRRRKEAERRQREREDTKAAALSKLKPEERSALNLG